MLAGDGEETSVTGKIHEIVSTAFHILAIVLLLVTFIPFSILVYWWMDHQKPIENVSVQFSEWDPANPETAYLNWTADRYRVCEGHSDLWLFADRPRLLQPETLPPPRASENIKKGATWTTAVRIPPEAIANTKMDHMYLSVRMVWHCNPLQRWSPLTHDIPEIAIPVRKNK